MHKAQDFGDSIRQGQLDAIRHMSKMQYLAIYRHQPELVDEKFAQREYLKYELEDKLLIRAWAITLNIGNHTDLEEFRPTIDHLISKLRRKRVFDEWYFVVEAAPDTGRHHIHLRCHMHPKAEQRFKSSIVDMFSKDMQVQKHFITVDPIYDEEGWLEYQTKDIVEQYSSKIHFKKSSK